MEELIKRLRQFAKEREWAQFHSPKNLAMALSVEVAEIVEHFQWLTQDESWNLDTGKRSAVWEEIGDAMIFLVMLSDKLGIDPISAAKEKMTLNAKKYPINLSKGNADKYTEF
jgi:NTP pyrophosphatase (non-canonical NTP hydrolase)